MVRTIENYIRNFGLLLISFRILPKLLAWLFQRKYKVILRIGRIGIPYLKLCDVVITKQEFTIVRLFVIILSIADLFMKYVVAH